MERSSHSLRLRTPQKRLPDFWRRWKWHHRPPRNCQGAWRDRAWQEEPTCGQDHLGLERDQQDPDVWGVCRCGLHPDRGVQDERRPSKSMEVVRQRGDGSDSIRAVEGDRAVDWWVHGRPGDFGHDARSVYQQVDPIEWRVHIWGVLHGDIGFLQQDTMREKKKINDWIDFNGWFNAERIQ